MATIFNLALLPVAMGLLSLALGHKAWFKTLCAASMWVQLLVVASIAWPVATGDAEIVINPDLVLTKVGSWFLILTTFVVAACLTHARVFFKREADQGLLTDPQQERILYTCFHIFLLATSTVFICNNLGYLWIAIEATTFATAPLVYFTRSRHAIEATWKYLIICSVGIAFALLGTVFIFASSQHGAESGGSLNISDLVRDGANLQQALLRLGFVFCFLGYGTKAGMFPIHSWLPDAHSEAPAPASALLSGALLNCALFGIWRVSEILLASEHSIVCHKLIVWVGTVTVVAASLFLVRQHALKRLCAYSSIENVGLMLVAIGLGSGALFFLQALNHSLAKVSLFLLSGNIVQATGTHQLNEMKGILRVSPGWAMLTAASAFAVTGAPPFGAFFAEWLILVKSLHAGEPAVAISLIFALALSFIAVCGHLGRVLVGTPRQGSQSFYPLATSVIPALLVSLSLILGFTTGFVFPESTQ